MTISSHLFSSTLMWSYNAYILCNFHIMLHFSVHTVTSIGVISETVSVRAELKSFKSIDVKTIEEKIVSHYEELEKLKLTSCDEIRKQKIDIEELLKSIKVTPSQLTMSLGHNILCQFTCRYFQQVVQLKDYYESGQLKVTLERIFTLLADINQDIYISHLDFNSSLQQHQNTTQTTGEFIVVDS